MSRVPKPYADGKWSQARMMSFIRSMLRQGTMRWAPRNTALQQGRRPNQSANRRLKWEYQCGDCNRWHPRKGIEIDHIIPAGSLRQFDDLPGFVERLYCEADGFRLLCKSCHHTKTHKS